jgi:hypothetical protein
LTAYEEKILHLNSWQWKQSCPFGIFWFREEIQEWSDSKKV